MMRLEQLTEEQADLLAKSLNRYTTPAPFLATASKLTAEAHGLGAVPRIFFAQMRCKSAELGYSVGELARLDSYYATTGGTVTGALLSSLLFTPAFKYYGASVSADSTNVSVTTAKDGIMVMDKSAFVPTLITPAKWEISLCAYL